MCRTEANQELTKRGGNTGQERLIGAEAPREGLLGHWGQLSARFLYVSWLKILGILVVLSLKSFLVALGWP